MTEHDQSSTAINAHGFTQSDASPLGVGVKHNDENIYEAIAVWATNAAAWRDMHTQAVAGGADIADADLVRMRENITDCCRRMFEVIVTAEGDDRVRLLLGMDAAQNGS